MTAWELGWALDLVLWMQGLRSPLIDALGEVFHLLGQQEFYLVIIPLIYWSIDAPFGRRVSLLFLISAWLNGWLKDWAARPRPYQVSEAVVPVVLENSYGIPSGHTQLSTSLWGAVAFQAKRQWVTVMVLIFLALMGLSRMITGVHYPQDILAGLLLGGLSVAAFAWLDAPITQWISRQNPWVQAGLVVGISAGLLVVYPLIFPDRGLDSGETAITAIGAFFGAGMGYILDARGQHFSAEGATWQRALRFVLGVAVALALRFGLGALFEVLEPAGVFRFIRYALIGLWLAYGAPWAFIRLRLAHSAAPAKA